MNLFIMYKDSLYMS